MLVHISKSARYLAIASCFAGLSGCSTEGAIGDLAMLGAIGGSMIPGVDSSTVMALGAVAAGSLVVVPLLSDDSNRSAPSSAPSLADAAPAPTTVAVATPPTVQAPIAKPAMPVSTINYCYAYLTVGEERGATCSPVAEINDIDGTRSVLEARLNSYIEKVKQSQPGLWGEFEYSKTTQMYGGFLYQMKPKSGLEASKQDAGLICLNSQAAAEDYLKRLKKNDSSLKIVGWL